MNNNLKESGTLMFLKHIKFDVFLLALFFYAQVFATVFVNQAGYLPNAVKMAYVDAPQEHFYLIDFNTGQQVYSGTCSLRASDDPSTGLTIYQADFSDFTTPGKYFVRVSDGQESFPFLIDDSAFARVSTTVLKGLYFQRCGMALEETNAGPYSHGSCHSADALFHASCDTSGYMPTRGGWHDAGDYGKYVVPAANALSYLLMLSEYFPNDLTSDYLNIPESGNGRPDLLDEAQYELNWLLTMQDPVSGGVYFKVTTKNFVGFIMPDQSTEARYIYEISSTATADFAAILARAYRIYAAYDSGFASQCLSAAKKAWTFLEQHPSIVPEGGFQNPDDTETGEYGDDDDSDERLWAAAELFESTGEARYNNYFLSHYQENGIIEEQTSWEYVKPLAQITYLRSTQSAASSSAKNAIRDALRQYADDQVTISQNDGFRVAMEGWEYYWGSNSVDLNKAIILIFVYEETRDQRYFDTALHQLNYILGCNAHNMAFATAIGSQSPRHIHHAPSAADGIDAPVPGLVVGGPNRYLDDPVLQSHFNSNTPPALCYIDDQDSYASNEIAIYWNTPLIFVSAYFNKGHGSTSVISSEKIIRSFRLLQNYPNPFNAHTVIEFLAGQDETAELTIYDLAGRRVRTLFNGKANPGWNQFIWEGDNDFNRPVGSGIYFYRLRIGRKEKTRKMVLLR